MQERMEHRNAHAPRSLDDGFDPIDLPESADEPNPHKIDSIKRKIMSLLVLTRLWKMADVPLAAPFFAARNARRISD